MRRAVLGACALLLAAAALGRADNSTAGGEELDEESDSASFVVMVEHAHGQLCGGSLVSQRTALTSATCAHGALGDPSRDLWALAPAPGRAPPRRRVWRVAHGAGAELDLALLELEAPFEAALRTRPILMAAAPAECAAPAACHVVRSFGRAARLSIVDADLAPESTCAARVSAWPMPSDVVLCVVGPELCAGDLGAGVVCGGKLCGVVSRSLRGSEMRSAGGKACGDTHAAQSVVRWRRFLRCAHTPGACHSGECSQLCSERRLLKHGEQAAPPGPTRWLELAPARTIPDAFSEPSLLITTFRTMSKPTTSSGRRDLASRTVYPHSLPPPGLLIVPSSPAARPLAPERSVAPSAPRPHSRAREFEPNRPDFKAGEYDDSAEEYGEDDAAPPTSVSSSAAPKPRVAPEPASTEAAPTERGAPCLESSASRGQAVTACTCAHIVLRVVASSVSRALRQ